jgi:hypothetical protein
VNSLLPEGAKVLLLDYHPRGRGALHHWNVYRNLKDPRVDMEFGGGRVRILKGR